MSAGPLSVTKPMNWLRHYGVPMAGLLLAALGWCYFLTAQESHQIRVEETFHFSRSCPTGPGATESQNHEAETVTYACDYSEDDRK